MHLGGDEDMSIGQSRRRMDDGLDVPDGAAPPVSIRRGDEGSALILVLVMIVIGSLIVIPTMTYAMTVMRANTVLSEKSKRIEGVKSGLRLALADPKGLYTACGAGGPTTAVNLASTTNNGNTISTKCYWLSSESSQAANEMRIGLVSTQVGSTPDPVLQGGPIVPAVPRATETEWLAQTSVLSETDKVWLPNLPVHGLSLRAPGGTQMPAGYPTCTVYFPGTYTDPVTLTGPTYFTSGVYYFEKQVTIKNGADVVVGGGATPGCTSDQEAIFYAVNVPSTHNMSGLGATWVLGRQARVVVSNADPGAAALSLRFNTRYVVAGDTGDAPSQGVSIETVNGDLALDGVTGNDLVVPGKVQVPLSLVGSVDATPATTQQYFPSTLTPKPQVPAAPAGVTATRYSGAARVVWTAPSDGGSAITGYTVTASSGATCSTAGALTCAVTGLTNGSGVTFTVTATNAVGPSLPSAPSASITPGGTSSMAVPSTPAAPTVAPYSGGVVRATWVAPADNGAPIKSYTATATPGGATCTVDMTTAWAPPLSCDLTGLNPLQILPGYTVTVTATNAVGTSVASAPSPGVVPLLALGTPAPAVPTAPASPAYVPTPVIDVDLSTAAPVTVDIPGYISMPQGRFRVSNPNGLDVRMAGGVMAATYDINDSRSNGGQPRSVPIGFIEAVVLRKFRIESTSNAGPETSTAIVQVKEQGAYGINSWEVQ